MGAQPCSSGACRTPGRGGTAGAWSLRRALGSSSLRLGRYWARFEAIRERLGVQRWFLCGQSFGAGLTLSYALAHSEQVLAQVFTNSMSALGPARSPNAEPQREARADAIVRGGHAAIAALPFYPRESRSLPPSLWKPLVEDGRLLDAAAIAHAVRTTAADLSVRARLGDIRVPTLLISGGRETAFRPLRDLAAARIPDLEVLDVDDGGHSVNLDAAEAFNDAVTGYLARHRAAGR